MIEMITVKNELQPLVCPKDEWQWWFGHDAAMITTSYRCERQMNVSSENIETDWVDPDDAPELDDAWFDKADLMIGDVIIRRGRPPGSDKKQISLRVDKAVIEAFRAQGPGWQSRINETLRKAVGI
jgi:uncharacterized protein (DUF4415 family)